MKYHKECSLVKNQFHNLDKLAELLKLLNIFTVTTRFVVVVIIIVVVATRHSPFLFQAKYTTIKKTWEPKHTSRDAWMRCHGFSCVKWERTKLKLLQLKMMASEGHAEYDATVSDRHILDAFVAHFPLSRLINTT